MDKRQDIIAAARARFRHYGLQKTTMQEIAIDADVAVGTLYRYFKDKNDLFVACADEFVSRHKESIEKLLAAEGPADEKLKQYLLGRFRTARESSTASMHAMELTRAVLQLKPERLMEEAAMMEATIIQFLAQGNASKLWHIKDPQHDARVLLFSIAHFFPNATMNLERWPTAEDLEFVLDWFIEMWSRGRRDADSD